MVDSIFLYFGTFFLNAVYGFRRLYILLDFKQNILVNWLQIKNGFENEGWQV